MNIWEILESKILPLVQKPGRYIGGEVNEQHKKLDSVDVRTALIFPDIYEVGMSNLALKILYEIINQYPEFYAERVFSPWPDMEEYMRRYNIPLFSLETHSALREFDILGLSVSYELSYTNILNMLDLAGIPLLTKERLAGNYPLIIAGGPAVYVPEPMAPFIDAFVIGDGEEVTVEILRFYSEWKLNGHNLSQKGMFLKQMRNKIQGVYVPYCGIEGRIKKRTVNDLDKVKAPINPVVPLIGIVHDRVSVEIMRGCPRRCRFCQAGVIYKPVRRRSYENLMEIAQKCIQNTGYEELGLASLSSTDFNGIEELVDSLLTKWQGRRISLSLPSMRIDSFSLKLINRISSVKKTNITLAPEAGTDKMLEIINKGYKADDVINVVRKARNMGYRLVKLYFMIGLPNEKYSDLDGIIGIITRLAAIVRLNISINTMIPKAHTPFQWQPMLNIDEIKKRQAYIRSRVSGRRIERLKFSNPKRSILEAVFSRGDRQLADVVYRAYKTGAKFDQWGEYFKPDIWDKAFRDSGINVNDYLSAMDYNGALAWDHIDTGISSEYLINESKFS